MAVNHTPYQVYDDLDHTLTINGITAVIDTWDALRCTIADWLATADPEDVAAVIQADGAIGHEAIATLVTRHAQDDLYYTGTFEAPGLEMHVYTTDPADPEVLYPGL